MLTSTVCASLRASLTSDRWPSCSAPMVGTMPMLPDLRASRAARKAVTVVTVRVMLRKAALAHLQSREAGLAALGEAIAHIARLPLGEQAEAGAVDGVAPGRCDGRDDLVGA